MNMLREFSQAQLASFKLPLSDMPDFECEEIVRCIPGKRLVCKGIWNGQAVYAKLFIGSGAKRYAGRDLYGAGALVLASIQTPAMLHAGPIADDQGEIIIFSAITDSVDAEQALSKLPGQQERLLLARTLVREVARHHNAGLIQQDLYLKNFLVQNGSQSIYTLDGDGIRPLSSVFVVFAKRQALQNLAVLLSKFHVVDEVTWLSELLHLYWQERGWQSTINLERMHRKIGAHRRHVVHGYADKKVFRRCSDVQVEKNMNFFTAISSQYADAQVKKVLTDPDHWLNHLPSQRLKTGNTCTVSLLEIKSQPVSRKIVVKRYNIKSLWHAIGRMFRTSRAAISWANAHRLRMHGIATAAPIAMREERFGPLRFKAYFFAEFIEGPDIGVWMDNAAISFAHREVVAANVAKLLYKMRLLQIAHGDLKVTNIHVVELRPVLIDLDSMHEYRCKTIFEYRHVRDLKRLLRNWQSKPQQYALMVNALKLVYGNDPLLARAGI